MFPRRSLACLVLTLALFAFLPTPALAAGGQMDPNGARDAGGRMASNG